MNVVSTRRVKLVVISIVHFDKHWRDKANEMSESSVANKYSIQLAL